MATKEEKEAEIESIYQTILQAIPINVCMVNIIIALSNLASEFTWELTDDETESEDDDTVGTLPGTTFSKS